MSLSNHVTDLLKRNYGFTTFRPGQEEAILNVLEGKDTIVIMPTGGGKSLCYQLPALALPGVTLVVSPLIALMKDQVDALVSRNIAATYINSALSLEETKTRLDEIENGIYKLVYIAPERFYNADFMNRLAQIKINLFAIDEAHCISQWGHDFRPSYMRLKQAIDLVGKPPVIALTATATPEVRADIIKQLEVHNPAQVITGFARPNLQFGVSEAAESQKPSIILDVLSSLPDASGIIYVGTRSKADEMLEVLLSAGIEAVGYHAGMQTEERKWVQENFMTGKAQVIVATNAFGMGIDKKNIRFVIHFDLPGTVEAYYQEAGRAGRDGKPSVCLLLYNPKDRYLREFFIRGDNPSPELVHQVYEYLLSYGQTKILLTYSDIKKAINDDSPEMAIGTSLKILERAGYIRRAHERVGQASLKLRTAVATARETLGPRAKKQLETFDKLFGRYEKEISDGFEANLEEIAGLLGVSRDALTRLIKKLVTTDSLIYTPPFRGTEIELIKEVEASDLDIDTRAMKEKAIKAYAKLDMMEQYVFTTSCRQKYLLNYFGDSELERCEKCDTCLKYMAFPTADGGEVEVELPSKKPASKLSTKLTQLETFDLLNQGLSISQIIEARGITEKTIYEHIAFLAGKGLKPNLQKIIPTKDLKAIETFLSHEPEAGIPETVAQFRGEIKEETIKLIFTLRKK
ncbi:MAG TPA: RecQ family ATP-dependent DNA helicase [bacterium]|nr:RecQ family ATP-dependent DNA helicase [bacterium]